MSEGNDARERALGQIMALRADQIERVYSGRPGCGCGCRGRYYEDERNIRRVLRAIYRLTLEGEEDIGVKDGVAWVQTEKRYYWAYLKGLKPSPRPAEEQG